MERKTKAEEKCGRPVSEHSRCLVDISQCLRSYKVLCAINKLQ